MSIRNPTVSEFETTTIVPRSTPATKHLLPTEYFAVKCSFILSGTTNAVANAIRRVICTELVTKALFVEDGHITTNDEFVIPELLAKRMRAIPLNQDCPPGAQFSLHATNDGTTWRHVHASELSVVGQHKLKSSQFSGKQVLLILNPGKTIKMNPITVRMESASTVGSGMHAVASACRSIAMDVVPRDYYVEVPGKSNEFTTEGISSTMADPRKWKISFTTNGTIDPAECVRQACDNIINRLTIAADSVDQITAATTEVVGGASGKAGAAGKDAESSIPTAYNLVLGGETDTIGNLFMKHTIVLFPEIHAASYHIDEYDKTCALKVRTIDDPHDVYTEVLTSTIDIFRKIKGQF